MGLRELLGGGASSGSLLDTVKSGNKQRGLLEMIMGGGEQYNAPIGPTPGGAPMPSDTIDPMQQENDRSSALAKLGSGLSNFGAGMSAAGGYSRMPVDFGQALAAGNQSLQAGQDRELGNELTKAKINQLSAKEFDLEKQAQQIMLKKQMGLPLTPAEEAIGKSYDAFAGAKLQPVTLPGGALGQFPSQRPVFGQMAAAPTPIRGGGQPMRQPTAQPRFRGWE